MAKKDQAAPAQFAPQLGDVVEARPRVADPPLCIPVPGMRAKFMRADWQIVRLDDYLAGIMKDGDLEIRPVGSGQAEAEKGAS